MQEEKEQEQDFGIPDDSGSKLEGWPSESDGSCPGNRKDGSISPELVKSLRKPGRKAAKQQPKAKTDLTPLLNALQVEIEETMDLLRLVRVNIQTVGPQDQKINILCRKVGGSLMKMEDIGRKIAVAVEG